MALSAYAIDKIVHPVDNYFKYPEGDSGLVPDIETDFVHLARLAADGKTTDVAALFKRAARTLVRKRPDLTDAVSIVLGKLDETTLSRSVSTPLPVDFDSRLELLNFENSPVVEMDPVWPEQVATVLNDVIAERRMVQRLWEAGVEPTKSLLLCGPPGTGKTLAATWLAEQLEVPLLTLDLSAVMSSFLGRTGNNIRNVLDYARRTAGVLLLDEFDALAKRRDDGLEIGELKRLVTVLLQEIDRWPTHSLLIAATNHPDLLDPAVWRRFDRIVNFPLPAQSELQRLICQLTAGRSNNLIPVPLLARLFEGWSFSDVTRTIEIAHRTALVRDMAIEDVINQIASDLCKSQTRSDKLALARFLADSGLSQRKIAEFTGFSRDTLRKHLNPTTANQS